MYYTQFTMDISERKRLVRRSYISPPLKIIEAILERVKKKINFIYISIFYQKINYYFIDVI